LDQSAFLNSSTGTVFRFCSFHFCSFGAAQRLIGYSSISDSVWHGWELPARWHKCRDGHGTKSKYRGTGTRYWL